MIPHTIDRESVKWAIAQVGKSGVPPNRRSTKYDLLFEGRRYPPKYIVSVAHSLVSGAELPPGSFSGGLETNNFLLAVGFDVVDKTGCVVCLEPVEEDEERRFPEGSESYRMHRRLERNSTLVETVKRQRLREEPELRCEACGFSFAEQYGPRGAGFIEAHHVKPVSELGGAVLSSPDDICLVCSNCHRMLHVTRPWLSVGQLGAVLRQRYALSVARRPRR